jgi:hypothetical protein
VNTAETAEWPQPREGIVGVDRSSDWLLSLDERATPHRDAILAITHHLYHACLVGHPTPNVERMYGRITDPQPGDFVYVRDRAADRDVAIRTMALGYLLTHRREWWESDEQWVAIKAERGETDADRRTDHAWYVQYGPNPDAVCRWTNCTVVAVPIDRGMFNQPAGTRNPDGSMTVTRDDLLGVLADDGFRLGER